MPKWPPYCQKTNLFTSKKTGLFSFLIKDTLLSIVYTLQLYGMQPGTLANLNHSLWVYIVESVDRRTLCASNQFGMHVHANH